MSPSYRRIGHIVKPHGIAGRMKVRLHEDAPESCWSEEQIYLQKRPNHVYLSFQVHSFYETTPGFALLELEAVRDRDKAEELRSMALYVAGIELPRQAGDDPRSFISYRLYDRTRYVGLIKDIYFAHIANPLFVLEQKSGVECLIPATNDFVRSISHKKRTLYVELPDGLLDLL